MEVTCGGTEVDVFQAETSYRFERQDLTRFSAHVMHFDAREDAVVVERSTPGIRVSIAVVVANVPTR